MKTDTIRNGMRENMENLRDAVKNSVSDKVEKVKNFNPRRREGEVAKAIESQTAKIPSDAFLWTGLGALAASLTLKLLKKDHVALFVGQWAAPFLLMGIYNKIVKVNGHDRNSASETTSRAKRTSRKSAR